ncbi:MAG: VWA domain-containing protein [Candidatus Cloacimonetes bacterium]|jgi:Mg-chelatase subunit ChlD|nr:VWA domain-containing protein [Candidatus Cloacimonadota bacterium]
MIRALADAVNWLESQSPENLESEIPKLPIRFLEDSGLSQQQQKLLREMVEMFKRYHNSELNLIMLKGIINFLSDPDNKTTILPSERPGKSLFMFDQQVSVKEIVKQILGLVKNRNNEPTATNNLPKYRTVLMNKLFKQNEEKSKFSIDTKDLQKVRMSFAKREKTKHTGHRNNNLSLDKGRIIRYSKEQSGNIAISPTIFNAIQNGNYSLKNRKFDIQTENFLYPKYEENVIYNIMLVLDTSKSISWVIPHIEKFISNITSNVSNSRDKLGLITFNDDIAQIFHYPTLNVKQVIGTINKIEAKGQTPLGEGLNLAVNIFSKEQYKIQGMKNLIILISDCFPEPLAGGHKDLLDEPSYKLVISAAEKIKCQKIGFIIINPAEKDEGELNWGKKLIKKVTDITNAKYIEVNPTTKYNLLKGETAFVDEEKLTEFYTAVNEVKVNI